MRLIDADRFKNWLMENYVCYDHTIADIDAQPTIDVEPVRHAKIINIPFGNSTYEGCSLCGADYNRYYSHGFFCSYCGAKFEEVNDE